MATLLLAMVMVLAMADMVMESELLMLILVMESELLMLILVMESELLILVMGILATLLMVLNISCSLRIFKDQDISQKSSAKIQVNTLTPLYRTCKNIKNFLLQF